MKKRWWLTFFLSLSFFTFGRTNFVIASENNYRVGVDYHATTVDLANSTFLSQYHQPEVRAQVLLQLQGMADAGVKVISTRLWMTGSVGVKSNFNLNFPLSDQELKNIQQYAQDVGSIKGKNGQYLDLYYILLYIVCADYSQNIYPKTVTDCTNYTWDQYKTIAKQNYDNFFNTIGDITRPDGKKAVTLAYFEGEAYLQKPNMDLMLKDLYPYFVDVAHTHGIEPSLYFMVFGPETGDVFNNQYTNTIYPAINGHSSLAYIYPIITFMKNNNLPIPQRLDMSFYPSNNSTHTKSNTDIINRILDDLREFYPNNDFGVSETNYFQNQTLRRELGQAFTNYYKLHQEPKETIFWTTPDSGGSGINAAYPFDISSYLISSDPIGNFDSVDCTEFKGWTCDSYNSDQPIIVHFYADNPYNAGGIYLGQTMANIPRETSVKNLCNGNSAHGFRFTVPANLVNNLSHRIYVYAINLNTQGINPLISGSPKTIICSPPTSTPTITPTTTFLPGDLDKNGKVDIFDYNTLISNFGKTGSNLAGDIDNNSKVDIFDYNQLVENFGK